MLTRTTLALLLLLPAVASAQDLDTALSAVVRISGMRNDTPVRGSGFVISLDRDKATIVTASHVIEGVQQLAVTFAADPAESFPASVVLGIEAGNQRGLAVFPVRGTLPTGVTMLSFATESRPRLGDALYLLGFPQMEVEPRMTQRVLAARRGTLLLVDQDVGEGFSGGPVLQGGKVVGVITDTDDQTTYAVNALVAREALEGWGIRLSGQSNTPISSAETEPRPAPQVVERCKPGEVRPLNGIDFVRICPGTFLMGSAENDSKAEGDETPAHEVTLTSEIWIGKTEITSQQYLRFQSNYQGADELPATKISWDDAKAACEYFGGRLPTEAEWEYAARAGTQTTWPFGDDEKMLGEYAWYAENSGKALHPVGTKRPNAWGLYDMHGNAWEWVADWYDTYTATAQFNPVGPKTGEHRVLRGGSFVDSSKNLRSAYRYGFRPVYQGDFGFRCVRDQPPPLSLASDDLSLPHPLRSVR